MRSLAVLWLAACLLPAASPEPVGPKRAAIVGIQNALNTRFSAASAKDPIDVLNATQGVYLRGMGAIFTAQVDLIVTPGLTPFRPKGVPPAEVAAIHRRKMDNVPVLKQAMQEMLVSTAKSLDALPLKEYVVLAVSLTYFSFEDRGGLPSQIVMKALREPLLKGAVNSIEVDEY